MVSPSLSVSSIKGIGTVKKNALNKLNILTIEDLLRHFPRDYEDRRKISKISELSSGDTAQIRATVASVEDSTANYGIKGGKRPFKLMVLDDTGMLSIVYFNASYLSNTFHIGDEFIFFGKVFRNGQMLQMTHPEFCKADDDSVGRILPVYPLSAALSQKDFRKWIDTQLNALNEPDFILDEFLPEDTMERNKICGIAYAFKNIHFPTEKRKLQEARYRMVFEELLILQTGLFMIKSSRSVSDGIAFAADVDIQTFLASLPFKLTAAQERSLTEISADMESKRAMNRLLQGDVGSGKTVVAAAAMYKAVKSGYQAVIMAPTETLAKQHYDELSKLFRSHDIRVGFLSGSVRGAERKAVLEGLMNQEIHVVAGTHALIQPDVIYRNLGLVITDEQHRFGVNQRIMLSKKGAETPKHVRLDAPDETRSRTSFNVPNEIQSSAFLHAPDETQGGANPNVTDEAQGGANPNVTDETQGNASPDVLVMTATPIPRTLAFILYGDLDISIMDERPPGRQSVVTRLVNGRGRETAYDFIRDEVKNGRQAYVVAPLIDETETSAETDMKSAKLLFDELEKRFKGLKVALLHGRMKQSEKDSVMQAFYSHDIDVLVSTVLIEVGINVPNATVMLIENAERFGLAQLHQLRGRVGRGKSQSYCFLVSNSTTKESRERLNVLISTDDGFVVAEKDLEIRGPGEFFGTRQHGIPPLKVANLVKHIKVLATVRDEAAVLMEDDPELLKIKNRGLREKIEQFFQSATDIGL